MNIIRVFLLICFAMVFSSCSVLYYYQIEDVLFRRPINEGYLFNSLWSIDPEIELSRDFNYDYRNFTNPYNKAIVNYLRSIELNNLNTYYALNVSYKITEHNLIINSDTSKPIVSMKLDSLFVKLDTPFKSYYLDEIYSHQKTLEDFGDPMHNILTIIPIGIPLSYKKDFELSFNLTILNEDESLLDKLHLNLKVERKKQVNTFLTPWP